MLSAIVSEPLKKIGHSLTHRSIRPRASCGTKSKNKSPFLGIVGQGVPYEDVRHIL